MHGVPRRAVLEAAVVGAAAPLAACGNASAAPTVPNGLVVNVRDYGAKGDGSTDDTGAIEAAYLAAGSRGAIYFPPGNFIYNGTGLDSAAGYNVIVSGAGNGATRITLGASSYFIKYSPLLPNLQIRNIYFYGGKGAINHTRTGLNVSGIYVVDNCHFREYTECAIQTQSADMPYWSISNCIFSAANQTSTIGVALGAGMDNCVIESCFFRLNRIHIKARRGGSFRIENCELNFWANDNSGGPRAAVWIVPGTVYTNSGFGMGITGGRFGNEGLADGDFRILIADEDGGASNGTKMPVLNADSTGFFSGLNVTSSYFVGTSGAANSIIYSTTPNIRHVQVHHNTLQSVAPNYVIQFRTPSVTPDQLSSTNLFGPFTGDISTEGALPFPASNAAGIGYWQDVQGIQQRANTIRNWASGGSSSFKEILSEPITSFTSNLMATTNTLDAYGGSDAVTYMMENPTAVLYCNLTTVMTAGMPLWVEFDVANPGDGDAADKIEVAIRDDPTVYHWRRSIELPSPSEGWVTYAFCFTPRTTGRSTTSIVFAATSSIGSPKTVALGRPRVYHANERQLGGKRPIVASPATSALDGADLANDLRNKLISLGIMSGTPAIGSVASDTGALRDGIGVGGQWHAPDLGLLSWAFDPALASGSSTIRSGQLYAVRLLVPAAKRVTNIHLTITAPGSHLAFGQCFAMLYQHGKLLARTEEQSGSENRAFGKTLALTSTGNAKASLAYSDSANCWSIAGNKVMPLTSPQQVDAGSIYVAFFANSEGGTNPSFARGARSTVLNVGSTGLNYRFGEGASGLTTAPPSNLGALTPATLGGFWAAVS